LEGKHCADFCTVKNIKEKSLNDIVFVMSEGDLVTFETMSETEQLLSSFPGTEEAGVFSILGTVRPSSDIRELDVVREPFPFKKILQDLGLPRMKTEVNINGKKFVMDRDSLASFVQKGE
jgi:hypothetical protein